MKYLWLTFTICLVALIAQIKLSDPPENPFADGSLACLPLPPEYVRPEPPLLPAPALDKIPPPSSPVRVVATSIQILNPTASTGLMVETRQADNADWGLPRSLPADDPVDLAYVPEARVVEAIPVNVPPPPPKPLPILEDLAKSDKPVWSPVLQQWNSAQLLLEFVKSQPMTDPDIVEETIASLPSIAPDAAPALKLYPVPPKEEVTMASLDPKRLMSAPKSQSFSPNLYLPDGATDEEGAKLTLIKPELALYELPDESSQKAPELLKGGDQVRPLTRLRNSVGYDWIKVDWQGKSWWAQAEYFIRVDPRNRRQFPEGNLAVGREQVDKDSALPVDYHPDDLIDIAGKYTFGAKNVQMRKEATKAFERMAAAAEKDGHQIRVFSGFRDFEYQKRLYLEAVKKGGPKQDGTAAPGYSEHQLGTTCDICSENRRTILQGTFGDTPEGRWLHVNSEKFGFRKSYTQENSAEVGYKPEPWHFRYIGVKEIAEDGAVARK